MRVLFALLTAILISPILGAFTTARAAAWNPQFASDPINVEAPQWAPWKKKADAWLKILKVQGEQGYHAKIFKGWPSAYLNRMVSVVTVQDFHESRSPANHSTPQHLLAENIGSLFYLMKLNHPELFPLKVWGTEIVDPTPEFGVVVFDSENFADRSAVSLLPTLFHEAKHSECVNFPSEYLERVSSRVEGTNPREISALRGELHFLNGACYHPHVACPEGHTLATIKNCDAELNGPARLQAAIALDLLNSGASLKPGERYLLLKSALEGMLKINPVFKQMQPLLSDDFQMMLKREDFLSDDEDASLLKKLNLIFPSLL